jgi:hypothetical protein
MGNNPENDEARIGHNVPKYGERKLLCHPRITRKLSTKQPKWKRIMETMVRHILWKKRFK